MNIMQRFGAAVSAFRGEKLYTGSGSWTNLYSGPGFGPKNRADLIGDYRSWVYACVNVRAKAVAAARFRLFQKVGVDEFLEIEDHPLYMILGKPNPWNTKSEFLYQSVTHLDLVGDAFWYVASDGLNRAREMWLLPVQNVKIIPSKTNFIARYEMRVEGGQVVTFGPEEIIHVKYPAPADPYYGLSPLSAAQYASDIDEQQLKYQRAFYGNSAIPSLVLETDKALTEQGRKELKETWQSLYGGENQGKTAVLDNGLKAKPVGISPKDLDWLSTRRVTRDEILGIFGVPASKLGLVEDVNRASAIANDYTFAVNVVEPILKLMDEKLTLDLAQRFDPNLVVIHDSTVPRDQTEEAATMEKRITVGLTTRNEERKLLGYEEIEGGDKLLVPLNYVDIEKLDSVQTGKGAPSVQNNQEEQQ